MLKGRQQNILMLLRSLHTTTTCAGRRTHRNANPGASHQLKVFEADDLSADPEAFGDHEADFTQVHKTHRQHEQEMQQERDRVRQHMIKHKYFRNVQLPNLLTYAEKEQMRLLHTRDPTEWTAERLAESFPVTLEVVEKILRAKWKPRTAKRVREHDEAAIHNWEKLRSGQHDLQLPAELSEHLKKFANRKTEDLATLSQIDIAKTELPKPKKQEFLSLITSCHKYAADEQQEKSQELLSSGAVTVHNSDKTKINANVAENETYLLAKVKDKRLMRFEELQRLKLTSADLASSAAQKSQTAMASLEQQAAAELKNPSGTGIVEKSKHAVELQEYAKKFESSDIVISTEDQKRFEMSTVKDRIHIPRKVWRKGATYRLEDTYYDDDGEFLYRVPGMTNKT